MAYGLATRLREADHANFPGRLRSNIAAGGTAERILAEVVRQLHVEGESLELVRAGVEDAETGSRRPDPTTHRRAWLCTELL
jgi:hypothetical protein